MTGFQVHVARRAFRTILHLRPFIYRRDHQHKWRFQDWILPQRCVMEWLLENTLQAGETMLKRYRDMLEPRFPEQVCKTYEGIVYTMLKRTSDRGTYEHAAEYLHRMVAMGYGERVEEIIDNLTSTHRRRRAMIEELNKVRPSVSSLDGN